MNSEKTLHYGMVGGGPDSYIGNLHLRAAAYDRKAEISAGCFSRDFNKTLIRGKELGLDSENLYKTYEEMADKESQKKDGIDFVIIVTPNNSHYEIAKYFLEKGINVVCDKPVTISSGQAKELKKLSESKNLDFCVTYTYSGYPIVKQAREMVNAGEIGDIRFIKAEYTCEWLSTELEKTGHKQAAWRLDPKQAGISCCVGDIGTHIENLAYEMTGLEIEKLSAKLDTQFKDRVLDDNASILVEFSCGAKGIFWASAIVPGDDNNLSIHIIGSKGSIKWRQEDPNYLTVTRLGKPKEILSRGRDNNYLNPDYNSRNPGGHPEGYVEALGNIYSNFCNKLISKNNKYKFPGIAQGLSGVKFIEKTVESSNKGSLWVNFNE